MSVTGLESTSYQDKVSSSSASAANGPISFSGETDRVYHSADKPLAVSQGGKTLYDIKRDGLTDVVVWNPWTEKAKGMSDFGPEDGWKRMVCVEAGSVKECNKLEGGEKWEGRQSIKAL